MNAAPMLLQGRYALVTGASRGIGLAIAEVLAGHGSHMIITSRHAEEAAGAAQRISESCGVRALGTGCDVSRQGSVDTLFEQLDAWTGGTLDILVNNAGFPMIPEMWHTALDRIPDEKVEGWFLDVLRTDTLGAVYCTRQALRRMIPRKSGKIVFITSTPALEGYRGTPYTVAKAAILGLMKDVAREYGACGIRANAMALGNIGTKATLQALDDKTRRTLAEEAPLGRWGLPEEVGRVALFLASDLSDFMTGQTLVVDGGTVRR